MNDHTFYCYICKEHIILQGESEKDARKKFAACGHDDTPVAQLRRGLPGFYTPENVLRREKNERDAVKAAKELAATGE